MNSVINLLNKVLVIEFYRMNSGFFLLMGTLAFGFMSGVEHKALAQYFVSTPHLTLIPVGIWILYALKVLTFNFSQIHKTENIFLTNIPFLSFSAQCLCTGISFISQFMPALAYGAFLTVISLQAGVGAGTLILIFISLGGCCVACTALMIHAFRNPQREKSVTILKTFLDHRYSKPAFQFYTEWLLREYPLMLAGTKIFCGGLLFAITRLYIAEPYDGRLLAMALTTCAMANLFLAYQLQVFEHGRISWVKNLPIRLSARYLGMTAVLALFMLPEYAVLIRYFPENLDAQSMWLSLFYLPGLAALFVGLLHLKAATLEVITKRCFWIYILFIILILFSVPLFLLALASVIVGYILFIRNYYQFEPYRDG